MNVAGYVLAGGNSTRMGRDKALLTAGDRTLAQQVGGVVEQAAGNAAIVGDPVKYGSLGFRTVPDLRPGNGPLSGLEAALTDAIARDQEWALVLACDLPAMNYAFLNRLLLRVFSEGVFTEVDCVVPRVGDQSQPLCALYRHTCLGEFAGALDRGDRKLVNAIARLRAEYVEVADEDVFQNVNTPAEWNRYLSGTIQR